MSDGLVGAPPSGPAQYGPVHEALRQGDTHDDDGVVFTRLLIDQEDSPPVVPSTPPAPVYPAPEERPEVTRTLTGNTILSNADPTTQQVLNADPRRKSLMIRLLSAVSTDFAYWSDDGQKTTAPSPGSVPAMAAQVFDRDGWVTIIDHTGPLFVNAFGTTTGTVRFMWCAVTK
jgi:hypothetical protein